MTKPKPCPFCGREPVVGVRASQHTTTGEHHTISCYCDGYASIAWQSGDSFEQVLAKWNARSEP